MAVFILAFAVFAPAQSAPAPGLTRALGYYDSTLKRVVLLGSAGDLKAASRDRLWSWSGTRWETMTDSGPRSRGNAGVAYDARRGVAIVAGGMARAARVYDNKRGHVVLFGGVGQEPARGQPQPFFGDTWVWERNAWRKVAEDGPRPRYAQGMVFDESKGVVLHPSTSTSPSLRTPARS